MANASRFQFIKSQHVPTLTVLQAAIEDFSYDRHAHEEFAFGVTLSGRQDFFSGGQFHKSPPGNVILFNPEEVHDGQPGGKHALDYLMVYAHPEQVKPLFADAQVGTAMFTYLLLLGWAGAAWIDDEALIVVSALGCSYIVYLAIKIARSSADLSSDLNTQLNNHDHTAHLLRFRDGLVMQLLNPKAIIATLPLATLQFPAAGIEGLSLVVWAFGLAILAAGAPGSYVLMGSLVGQRIQSAGIIKGFNWVMAGLLVAVALSIGYEHVWLPLNAS